MLELKVFRLSSVAFVQVRLIEASPKALRRFTFAAGLESL